MGYYLDKAIATKAAQEAKIAALQTDNDDLTQLIADTVDAQYSADLEVLSNV